MTPPKRERKIKMKKLIIAAAIVCAAALSQAASVSWTCTLVKNGSAGASNAGIAYLMLASDVADFTALAGKGATAVNAALADALISYTPGTAGKYTHDAVDNATLGLTDGTSYGNAYLVIFDTATVTDASKFYVTQTKALETYEGDKVASLSFGSQSAASKLDSNWNAVAAAVPEPTSGLLLLLGVAGLALKRKRA